MLPKMTFYCSKESDGTIHVQNAIMEMMSQHHVHTLASFKAWTDRLRVEESSIEWLPGPCDCGLKAGETVSGGA